MFGEGPPDAALLFVGEQPGDQEDRQGRPFVGPAGQLFDRALAEAGIDRARRSTSPTRSSTSSSSRAASGASTRSPTTRRCSPASPGCWARSTACRPGVVVALGATAAQSLMGRDGDDRQGARAVPALPAGPAPVRHRPPLLPAAGARRARAGHGVPPLRRRAADDRRRAAGGRRTGRPNRARRRSTPCSDGRASRRCRTAALSPRTVHLCVDMQNLFMPGAPWATPWMPRVLPVVEAVARRDPARTIFTRFVPPERPDQASGRWRAYFEAWREVTRERGRPRAGRAGAAAGGAGTPRNGRRQALLLAVPRLGAAAAAPRARGRHAGRLGHGDGRLRPGRGARRDRPSATGWSWSRTPSAAPPTRPTTR